jgi:hypothetical protein
MDGSAPSELDADDRTGSPAEDHTSEWPRISDYWPDAAGAPPETAPEQAAGQPGPLDESTAPQPVVYPGDDPGAPVVYPGEDPGAPVVYAGEDPGAPVVYAGDDPAVHGTAAGRPGPTRLISPPPPPRRSGLRLAVAGVSAGIFLGISVLVLTRLVSSPDEPPVVQVQETAPPIQEPTGAVNPPPPSPPVSIVPSPDGSAPPASADQAAPPFTEGTFELVSDVVELNLAIGRPASGVAQASTPDGSGITARAEVKGSTIKLSTKPNGRKGPSRVDVLLDERVAWTVRTSEGVTRATFDLADGTVRGISLGGGATTIDMTLPRQDAEIPIRMSGGVNTWRIRTEEEVPVRVRVRRGAGEVVLYGDKDKGVHRGETLQSDGDGEGRLEIDAVAGLGTLTVSTG